MSKPQKMREQFENALGAATFIACHTFVVICLIGAIKLISLVFIGVGDPKLFDYLPLRYVFDAMDLGILAAFLIFAVVGAVRWFGE